MQIKITKEIKNGRVETNIEVPTHAAIYKASRELTGHTNEKGSKGIFESEAFTLFYGSVEKTFIGNLNIHSEKATVEEVRKEIETRIKSVKHWVSSLRGQQKPLLGELTFNVE